MLRQTPDRCAAAAVRNIMWRLARACAGNSGLSQAEFVAALSVSKHPLEQWEQGCRKPSGAAKQLLKISERHAEVLVEVAA
ncbi:MAG: hypothetical protein P0120_20285 [Nitrospira sp.]|nr:hypothetical protein [Nitrospira sp.]